MEKSNDRSASAEYLGSEADFLAEQAATARQALTATLERMRTDLGDSADLAAWARRYPWPTMGIAAAAGFLAVVAMGSPASSRTSGASASPEESDSADEQAGIRRARDRRETAKDRGLFQSLMSELLRNFASAAQGALLAAIGARFQGPPVAPVQTPPGVDPTADPMAAGASSGNGFAPSDL